MPSLPPASMPPASKQVHGEGRARGEFRRRTERGEKDLRARAGRRQQAVGGIAQRFEGLREADRLQSGCRGLSRRRRHIDLRVVFGEIGEYADPGQRILPSRQRGRAVLTNRRDFLRNEAAGKRRGDAAGAFNLAELRPGRPAQRIGQIFDGARPGRRVGDLGKVRLFEKNELSIARDAPRKTLGQAASGGKRQHRDRIGPAERGREA